MDLAIYFILGYLDLFAEGLHGSGVRTLRRFSGSMVGQCPWQKLTERRPKPTTAQGVV